MKGFQLLRYHKMTIHGSFSFTSFISFNLILLLILCLEGIIGEYCGNYCGHTLRKYCTPESVACDVSTRKCFCLDPGGLDCPPIREILNGNSNCKGNKTDGSECIYSCDEGFELIGNKTRTCDIRFGYSGDPPLCKIIACKTYADFLNGKRRCQKYKSNHPTEGFHTCTFSCKCTYKLIGSKMVSCDGKGKWKEKMPTCKPRKTCGYIPTAKNTSKKCLENPTTMLTQCLFTCKTGFYLNSGNNIVNCSLDGNWSNNIPHCIINDTFIRRPAELLKVNVTSFQVSKEKDTWDIRCSGRDNTSFFNQGDCYTYSECIKGNPSFAKIHQCIDGDESDFNSESILFACTERAKYCYDKGVYHIEGPVITDVKCPVSEERFPHPRNCISFVSCRKRIATLNVCFKGFVYDKFRKNCIKAGDVENCVSLHNFNQNCTGKRIYEPNHNDWRCQSYFDCTDKKYLIKKCPDGRRYHTYLEVCLNQNITCPQKGDLVIPNLKLLDEFSTQT